MTTPSKDSVEFSGTEQLTNFISGMAHILEHCAQALRAVPIRQIAKQPILAMTTPACLELKALAFILHKQN